MTGHWRYTKSPNHHFYWNLLKTYSVFFWCSFDIRLRPSVQIRVGFVEVDVIHLDWHVALHVGGWGGSLSCSWLLHTIHPSVFIHSAKKILFNNIHWSSSAKLAMSCRIESRESQHQVECALKWTTAACIWNGSPTRAAQSAAHVGTDCRLIYRQATGGCHGASSSLSLAVRESCHGAGLLTPTHFYGGQIHIALALSATVYCVLIIPSVQCRDFLIFFFNICTYHTLLNHWQPFSKQSSPYREPL